MPENAYLLVESGSDKGRSIAVPPDGARFGRSSHNDEIINDPKISRHHCFLYHKPGVGLYVIDLGSANQTLVNDRPIQEHHLQVNDVLQLGDSRIRVTYAPGGPPPPPSVAAAPPRTHSARSARKRKRSLGWLLALGILGIPLAALGIWILVSLPGLPPALSWLVRDKTPAFGQLDIAYEKVVANADRIFRYSLRVTPDRQIEIHADDTGNVHVSESTTLSNSDFESLAIALLRSGFLNLDETYTAPAKPNTLEQYAIDLTINRLKHRVVIRNRTQPSEFSTLRETLETIGRIELGLSANRADYTSSPAADPPPQDGDAEPVMTDMAMEPEM